MSEADPRTARAYEDGIQGDPIPAADPAVAQRAKRRRLLTIIVAVVLVLGVGYGAYDLLVLSHYVSTDNAYVDADVAQVTPLVAAPVTQVAVGDTQVVRKGDLLVVLDDSDMRIAVDQAEADLVAAQRKYNQTQATSEALAGQVAARAADIASAQAQLAVARSNYDRANVDLTRRQKLAKTGAVSGDELTSATNAFQAAKANLVVAQSAITQAQSIRSAAKGNLAANEALTTGTTLANNPDVLAAKARLEQAELDLSRTRIRAPIDGVVTSRKVQVGQRVAPGTAIMTIVPVSQLYVDANFKEGQLARVRPGQPVTLTSDLYGGDVVYHGRVAGFSGGTGAAFSLIPAQNATGNWIKVVQRLPVRVSLDPKELRAHPLRVGLSMDAEINLNERAN